LIESLLADYHPAGNISYMFSKNKYYTEPREEYNKHDKTEPST